jgi:triphosphoribosyl-dephospho-CoA synthetase
MKTTFRKTLGIIALTCSAAMVSGCASVSREEFEEVKGMAQTASSDAKAALDAANNANACCQKNSEQLERLLSRTMRK